MIGSYFYLTLWWKKWTEKTRKSIIFALINAIELSLNNSFMQTKDKWEINTYMFDL